ncbi:unnamed protein product [Parascedosporium putredinis]|uniref:Uncharacterized protein n=1 Tax=Parascedosporium putredinis TaxID=1442378 RepID=A0A9P1H4E3_9PEZI|nr:unnamed protein product [Parascedosporium putredinis]CAI7996562.1 unnamed protein product [Parascedosporium putredinis]
MSTQGTDRNARGKLARTIINNVIPTILKGNPVRGAGSTRFCSAGTGDAPLLAVLMIADTLEAAAHIRSTHLTLPHRRQPRIAVLNMASPYVRAAECFFRLDDDMPAKGSAQKDWFFVDVITAAMHRLPK